MASPARLKSRRPVVRRFEQLELRLVLGGGSPSVWPHRVFAPYVDTTLWPAFNLVQAAQTTNNLDYTLAFIVADTSNQPCWGGQSSLSVASGYMADQISGLRALGGDVIVSFGGANGTELAGAIPDPTALQAAYQTVVDKYALTRLDFDIEGAAVNDHASIDRRSQALAGLQQAATAAGHELQIWLTLPVLPTGLTADGMYVVQSALSHGVQLGGVNGMAMDFGDWAAPNPAGQMGEYAIQSADGVFNQLKQAYTAAGVTLSDADLWHKVGVTPMIGVNDQQNEVFDQTAAGELLAFAMQNDIGELAFWSATRDQPPPAGQLGQVAATHSGIAQTPFEFTELYQPFTGAAVPSLAINSIMVNEADPGTVHAVFTVRLSQPLTQTVTVQYATVAQTAVAGSDYEATSGTLTFAPGEMQQTISVPVYGHIVHEADDQFLVRLSNAVGAPIALSDGRATLHDNYQATASAVQFAVTSDWGSGFQGQISVTNNGAAPVSDWHLEFDSAVQITSIWDAVVQSHTGSHYVIAHPTWSDSIAAGATASFGFVANPGNVTAGPANYTLNGVSLETGPLLAAATDWTPDGLTLTRGDDGLVHLYRTGTAINAVTAKAPANVTNIQIAGGTDANEVLTIDYSRGNPLPQGGVIYYDGGSQLAGGLRIVGTSGNDAVTLTATQIIVAGMATIAYRHVGSFGFDLGTGQNALAVNGTTLRVAGDNAIAAGTALNIGSGGHVVLAGGLGHAISLGGLTITSGAGGTAVTASTAVQSPPDQEPSNALAVPAPATPLLPTSAPARDEGATVRGASAASPLGTGPSVALRKPRSGGPVPTPAASRRHQAAARDLLLATAGGDRPRTGLSWFWDPEPLQTRRRSTPKTDTWTRAVDTVLLNATAGFIPAGRLYPAGTGPAVTFTV